MMCELLNLSGWKMLEIESEKVNEFSNLCVIILESFIIIKEEEKEWNSYNENDDVDEDMKTTKYTREVCKVQSQWTTYLWGQKIFFLISLGRRSWLQNCFCEPIFFHLRALPGSGHVKNEKCREKQDKKKREVALNFAKQILSLIILLMQIFAFNETIGYFFGYDSGHIVSKLPNNCDRIRLKLSSRSFCRSILGWVSLGCFLSVLFEVHRSPSIVC